jgi:MYXO-CTERM domain-containing protein
MTRTTALTIGSLPLVTLLLSGQARASCPASVTVEDVLTCSSSVTGQVAGSEASRLGGTAATSAYSCGTPYAPLAQTAGEDVYAFSCQANGDVTLEVTGMDCDLDIYVLEDSCDPYGGCHEGSTEASTTTDSVTFACFEGDTYYIVIEGYGYTEDPFYTGYCWPGEGNYTLSFDVSAGTGCPEDCYDGVDNDFDGYTDCDDSDCDAEEVCCDDDGDGYLSDFAACGGDDCDDDDADVYPGADEYCNDLDDDCDFRVDEDGVDGEPWWEDFDGDGYGDPADEVDSCDEPSGYTDNDDDCDDTSSLINPDGAETCNGEDDDCDGVIDEDASGGATFYADDDGDGFGDASDTIQACEAPDGYVADNRDCDDSDADIHPGADEYCDEVDQDCDSRVDEDALDPDTWYRDSDNDGYGDPATTAEECDAPSGFVADDTDCDDSALNIHPGADETCNEIDDDCDTAVDEDATDLATFYADDDSDGYGDPDDASEACEQPSGTVTNSSDCDDSLSTVYPGAAETCNDIDDDCDSSVDEDATDWSTWYADDDNDSYGDPSNSTQSCDQPDGYLSDDSDCDDSLASVYPGAAETCNDIDDDCDSSVDEDATDWPTWYADDDSDGYGDASDSVESCDQPDDYISDDSDCDDAVASTHPGADETCNDVDDDCDTTVDEDATDLSTFYADDDSDGYGDPDDASEACEQPSGTVTDNTDCDDSLSTVYPGADETCNDIDDDCDSSVDEDATDWSTWYADDDSDGFGDASDSVENCDQPDGYLSDSTDCDDSLSTVYPGAEETCNELDDDCDTTVDEDATDWPTWYADVDTDGYGDPGDSVESCDQPDDYISDDSDCDDTNGDIYPGADEVCNTLDDDCDSVVDEDAEGEATWYADGDSDGFGVPDDTLVDCEQPDGYVATDTDCDDGDASIFPGADEVCDDVDQDCDDVIDENALDRSTWYADDDSDSYGDASDSVESCDQPDGYISDSTDCDDTLDSVYPGADEYCNEIDDDCDTVVDEEALDWSTWYADDDEDEYGNADDAVQSCEQPDGYISDSTDCDDTNADVNPGEEEIAYDGLDNDCEDGDLTDVDGDGEDAEAAGGGDCDDTDTETSSSGTETADGADDDCDDIVDEGTEYYDDDGDGYTEYGGDCDDTSADVEPDADEDCDGVDQDCDDIVDEGTDCFDDDEDGYTEEEGDCNDADPDANPGEVEDYENGVDDDCNGQVDNGAYDADGDGYLPESGDCEEDDASAYPGAPEEADGVDDDCDGIVDEGTDTVDDDGDSVSDADGDCDDTAPGTYPGAPEEADGVDNDCDDIVDEGTPNYDDDGDGFSESGGDCDDSDATVHPGAEEQPDSEDDDCDDAVDEGVSDADEDGWSVGDGDCDDNDGWVNPDTEEFCDGVDNDCDGQVDETDCVDLDASGLETGKGGCSCASATGGAPTGLALLPLLGLVGWRRRRT